MGFEYRSQVRPSTGEAIFLLSSFGHASHTDTAAFEPGYADPKESIQLGMGYGPNADMNVCWPSQEDCPDFKADAKAFAKEVQALSVQIMELLAEGLGMVSLLPVGFKETGNDGAASCRTRTSSRKELPAQRILTRKIP